MAGYTIAYWGDTQEVSYLVWYEGADKDLYVGQFECIYPSFTRFLVSGQITEILEHSPDAILPHSEMVERIEYWRVQLGEQGYDVH